MKTLAEIKNQFFDWNEFLKQENYTKKELMAARTRSASWVSCACGNTCVIIPRDSDGEPNDKKLALLGRIFFKCISDMHRYDVEYELKNSLGFRKAKKNSILTLKKIEMRSNVLINIEIKKMKDTIKELGFVLTKKKK